VKALVIGATGTVGKDLVKMLLEDNTILAQDILNV